MTRATILSRQRAARSKRAHKRGNQFADFIAECARAGVCNDAWLAHHIGQLVQRVEELEARVARLEGKR